jgi:hypothetical protein
MYDISFIMPVCDSTKYYYKRFLDLKKYCAVNSEGRTVRWKLLVGPNEDFYGIDMTEGWPSNMTVEIVRSPYLDPSQKISHYYTQMTDEEIASARWHAKFDDDTATDINKLLYFLDDELDYTDKHYLVTELRREVEKIENDILTDMGYGQWITDDRLIHEWEGCIASQAAMAAVQKNEKAQTYLKRRMAIRGGYGDQPVAIAMRFCKILPINPLYLSVWAKPSEFTLFGGQFAHVHFFLGRSEMAVRSMDFFKCLIDKKDIKEISGKIVNTDWTFKKDENHDKKISLWDNNVIAAVNHHTGKEHKIGMWTVYKDNRLALVFGGSGCGEAVNELQATDKTYKLFTGTCLESKNNMTLEPR